MGDGKKLEETNFINCYKLFFLLLPMDCFSISSFEAKSSYYDSRLYGRDASDKSIFLGETSGDNPLKWKQE